MENAGQLDSLHLTSASLWSKQGPVDQGRNQIIQREQVLGTNLNQSHPRELWFPPILEDCLNLKRESWFLAEA